MALVSSVAKKSTLIDKCVIYDCEFNDVAAFEKICSKLEAIKETYTCWVCNFSYNNCKKTIFVEQKDFNEMENVLKHSDKVKCRNCDADVTLSSVFESQLFIDTGESQNVRLDKIPFLLNLSGKAYILRAVIGFNMLATRNATGH